ncbi:unnamed protein product [Kluyveromyces dobzhanskii CBS 2104]|uniref:Dol-P-Man:Man(5)GlcNAc(2)-PP-Dol alpha-1,3-mannosyltransferase n=1 Tax=Kluyveromyces dobzhanskii CBS 2104 TaxID=1427455 RepID=A0A0A8LA21_9SACH|nr:unnamed protein product [Kluyveromyces dobzhanskii CBS 2104]
MSNEHEETVAAVAMGSADQQSKEFVRPEFTPIQDLVDGFNYLMWDPRATAITMPLLLLLESITMKVIQKKVSYTEIDYTAYMEQIWAIQNGERDYSKISGGTGPLVYPAGHVLIYKAMEWASDGLNNVEQAQGLFRYLYLITLLIQFVCFSLLNVPSGYVVLAVLSKRLHSIYVLRLFNDCFTTLFVSISVLAMLLSAKYKMRGIPVLLGSTFYSIAVSIKMNALLYLPGVLLSVYLLERGNTLQIALNVATMAVWQIAVATPFWKEYPKEYIQGAFNFGRQFMYKWSVNWQMLDEESFVNPIFHRTLLVSHVTVLLTFLFYKMLPRELTPSQLLRMAKSNLLHPFTDVVPRKVPVSPSQIAYILLTSNYIGILFSRSLHYQFLSWYHWTLPVLLHWARMPYILTVAWYLAHEWCWNSYPPNATQSTILHACNTALVLAIFLRALPAALPVTEARFTRLDVKEGHEKAE